MCFENRTSRILLGLSEEFIITFLAFIPAKRPSPDSKFARYVSRRHTACRLRPYRGTTSRCFFTDNGRRRDEEEASMRIT